MGGTIVGLGRMVTGVSGGDALGGTGADGGAGTGAAGSAGAAGEAVGCGCALVLRMMARATHSSTVRPAARAAFSAKARVAGSRDSREKGVSAAIVNPDYPSTASLAGVVPMVNPVDRNIIMF